MEGSDDHGERPEAEDEVVNGHPGFHVERSLLERHEELEESTRVKFSEWRSNYFFLQIGLVPCR